MSGELKQFQILHIVELMKDIWGIKFYLWQPPLLEESVHAIRITAWLARQADVICQAFFLQLLSQISKLFCITFRAISVIFEHFSLFHL